MTTKHTARNPFFACLINKPSEQFCNLLQQSGHNGVHGVTAPTHADQVECRPELGTVQIHIPWSNVPRSIQEKPARSYWTVRRHNVQQEVRYFQSETEGFVLY